MYHSLFRNILCVFSFSFVFIYSQPAIFIEGESFIYNASFNYIPAGRAELSIVGIDTIDANEAFHVRYTAKTGAVVDKLFRIRDQIDIWLDKKDLFTYRQVKKISEGSYRYKAETNIIYKDSIAVSGSDTTRISGLVRDPYSLFYYLRTIDLSKDSVLTFTTYDRKKLTTFQMKVGKTETLRVPAGKFKSFRVRPYHKNMALLKNKGEMDIWFSSDARRIPIQILVRLKFGTLTLKLESFN